MIRGEFLCHREEEVRVQEVRAAEAAVRAVGAVRQADGAVRPTAVLIVVTTSGRTAEAVHRRFLPGESGGISRRGFRRI